MPDSIDGLKLYVVEVRHRVYCLAPSGIEAAGNALRYARKDLQDPVTVTAEVRSLDEIPVEHRGAIPHWDRPLRDGDPPALRDVMEIVEARTK